MTRRLPLFLLLAALAAGGYLVAGRGEGSGGDSAPQPARVVRVVDGDTIVVRFDGREERVRYIGIDTPESVKPGTPVECFAKKASAYNARLLASGRVTLTFDAERRDRYRRLLAYVYAEPGHRFVNAALAREGYAQQLTIPPNVKHEAEFRRLVAAARKAGRGLWSACEPAA